MAELLWFLNASLIVSQLFLKAACLARCSVWYTYSTDWKHSHSKIQQCSLVILSIHRICLCIAFILYGCSLLSKHVSVSPFKFKYLNTSGSANQLGGVQKVFASQCCYSLWWRLLYMLCRQLHYLNHTEYFQKCKLVWCVLHPRLILLILCVKTALYHWIAESKTVIAFSLSSCFLQSNKSISHSSVCLLPDHAVYYPQSPQEERHNTRY